MVQVAIALFLIIGVSTQMSAQTAVSDATETSEIKPTDAPDFAYPQTVIDNAEVLLDDALKHNRSLDVVKAVIQIVVANNRISKDNAPKMIALVDSIAQTQPTDIKSILYSLEAGVYHAIYIEKQGLYNNRNVPLDNPPSDPFQWSKDLFALKIFELTEKSLENSELLFNSQITAYKEILKPIEEYQIECFPTLYDMLAHRAVSLLENFARYNYDYIPFFETKGKGSIAEEIQSRRIAILKKCEEEHKNRGNVPAYIVAAIAYNIYFTQSDEAKKLFMSLYKQYENSPYSTELLIALYNKMDSDHNLAELREFDNIITRQIERYPDYFRINGLIEIKQQIEFSDVSFIVDAEVHSSKEIKVIAEGRNFTDLYIQLYKIPSDIDRNDYKQMTISTLLPKSKLIETKKVNISDKIIPNVVADTLSFSPCTYGYYFLVPAKGESKKDVLTDLCDMGIDYFQVTDLTVFVSSETAYGPDLRAYVVDNQSGKPLNGVKVNVSSYVDNNDKKVVSGRTSRDGYMDFALQQRCSYNVEARRGDDSNNVSGNISSKYEFEVQQCCSIFTNLALYHPGDTVKYTVVTYQALGSERTLLKNRKVNTLLKAFSSRRNVIASDTLVTDENGRANGFFVLPTTGLRGTYMLEADKGHSFFSVEEYQPPTFYAEFSALDKTSCAVGDTVRIEGVAKTYSGMPVENADVNYNVMWHRWWRYASQSECSYAGELKTDSNGHFIIELPTENLRNTQFACGRFELNVTVTDNAGESVAMPQQLFSLGSGYTIFVDDELQRNADSDTIDIPVNVRDILDKIVKKELAYRMVNAENKNIVYEGSFTSPKLTLTTENIPSGKYDIEFYMPSDTLVDKAFTELILCRSTDKRLPFTTALWLPESEIVANDGDEEVAVRVGTSLKDAWVLCEIADTAGFVSRKWERLSDEIKNIKVPAPHGDNKYRVDFVVVSEGKFSYADCMIYPPGIDDCLTIHVETFRDKLRPQTQETWKFRFDYGDKAVPYLPAMAVMSDKSLNSIRNFKWNFDFDGRKIYLSRMLNYDVQFARYNNYGSNEIPDWNYSHLNVPALNFYGQALYSYYRDNIRIQGYGSVKYETNDLYVQTEGMDEVMLYEAESETVDSAMPLAKQTRSTSGNAAAVEESVEYRESECPSAFFYPSLTADENGVVEVSFEVPNFNTTWQFQLLGYTHDVQTATWLGEAVSSKPVMVKSNLPRFLTTGDDATLLATIYNNSEDVKAIGGRIELFDPMTDKVLASQPMNAETMQPAASRVVTISYKVPDTLQFIGYRVYASADGFTDGEQDVIAVLPSSSPVIESKPFYLGISQDSLEIKLPNFDDDARVTLRYCSNPVWYCVTALPELYNGTPTSVFSKMDALFGNAVVAKLLKEYPQVGDAIRLWSETGDSILISNLQKNEDLKTVALENTPWLDNAESESLRMLKLVGLLNESRRNSEITRLIKEVKNLQTADGSWRWCPNMPGSLFATMCVLSEFAELRGMNLFVKNTTVNDMISKAITYCDKVIATDYKKQNTYSKSLMLNYLYIRSFFKKSITNPTFLTLRQEALNDIAASWRDLSIYNKATAAILLSREKQSTVVADIMESIRQHAMTSPERGMWFDNLSGGYWRVSKMNSMRQVLMAYHEIEPANEAVDMLRQWMIIERQTQDWQPAGSNTTALIAALLTTGSSWISGGENSQITLDGMLLDIPATEAYSGAFTMYLSGKDAASKTLKINKQGGQPAWGSIITQGIIPIDEIKSAAIDDLSIEKRIFVVDDREDGTYLLPADTLKVGQRVRVQLTIKNKRDMDYVAITDRRAACLSPVVQTSQYDYQDGIWAYREVRNESNNIFISRLGKGTNILTYDCFVTQSGEYSLGIATIQSQYAPEMTAHSAGNTITATPAE